MRALDLYRALSHDVKEKCERKKGSLCTWLPSKVDRYA